MEAHFLSTEINAQRIQNAKSSYTTRRVNKNEIKKIINGDTAPQSGDLVLARIEKINQHKRIELEHGRKAPLFEGDEIIVCYGHRYAPDQFEAEIPNDLKKCHLVAAGGVASLCLSKHKAIKSATTITPIGILADEHGQRVNINQWCLPHIENKNPAIRPLVIAIVGSSMNAGKTTTAAHLIHGLKKSGMKVGAAKLTGTGAGGDVWLMKDAGADVVYDFTDAGYASTYRCQPHELNTITSTLVNHLKQQSPEAIVLELADGLLQPETASLLQSNTLRTMMDGIIFAASDSMGAHNGVQWLTQHSLPIIGISGCLTASPLAIRETQKISSLPIYSLEHLSHPDIATELFENCGEQLSSLQQAMR